MNIVARLGLLIAVGASLAVCTAPVAFAETTAVEIKANDTLGAIVNNVYPGYRNRRALMQLILDRNPDAFIDNNVHFLIIGKTLNLPGADELGAAIQTAPPPIPVQQVVTPVLAETERRLKQVVEERDQLKQQLEKLETDNEGLRATVSRLEAIGTQQSEQLEKLEEQIESLKSLAEEQGVATEATSSDAIKQLAESGEKLNQLQARYDQSINDNKGLQQKLTEKAALETEISGLKQQLTDLQADGETQKSANTELQSQLDALKQQSETLRADNEKVSAELSAVSKKLEVSQSEADTLRTKLEASNQQLEVSQSEATTLRNELTTSSESNTALQGEIDQVKATAEQDVVALRTELNASSESNTALQSEIDQVKTAAEETAATLRAELSASSESNTALKSEIDQIKAAAEKGVTLSPTTPSEKPGAVWWPWLLALLLLPVAWLLGQRSRPAPVVNAPEAKPGVKTIEISAAADPVVPKPLTSDQLDQMAFSGIETITIPDNPDAAIKLDMARAYMDLRNTEAANDVLQDVIREGGSQQQQEAKEILSFIA